MLTAGALSSVTASLHLDQSEKMIFSQQLSALLPFVGFFLFIKQSCEFPPGGESFNTNSFTCGIAFTDIDADNLHQRSSSVSYRTR